MCSVVTDDGGGPLVDVQDLHVHFDRPLRFIGGRRQRLRAVDGVSLTIERGSTLGLVGESGSGKTTLGRAILRLVDPVRGRVLYGGRNVYGVSPGELRRMRRRMQIVLQDPLASLNPRMTVGQAVAEPFEIHRVGTRRERRKRVEALLGRVGLDASHADRYPHELSGGQCQRVGIARAIALEPEFIVLDEPVSALDVSIQAQILNLLSDLKEELGLTCLFITHDLAVVRRFSDRIAVMYRGRIVEMADSASLYAEPQHPYTQALLAAVPVPDPTKRREPVATRDSVDEGLAAQHGCSYAGRCQYVEQTCRRSQPQLDTVSDSASGHLVACHFPAATRSQAARTR